MIHKRSNTVRSGPSALGRCFWAAMVAAHAPALASSWESFVDGGMAVGLLGGCAALTATTVFFALKLYGVSFLRVSPGRHSIIAMALVVGLIHVDCLRPALDGEVVNNCVAVVAITSFVGGLAALGESLRARRTAGESGSTIAFNPRRFAGGLSFEIARPCCWVLALALFTMRAPPAWH